MREFLPALALVVIATACDHSSSGGNPAPAPSGATPTGPVPADVTLASSRSTRALPTDALVVVLSRTRLALGRDGATLAAPDPASWAQGFEARYKRESRNDFFVLPLGNAMAAAYPGEAGVPEVAVAADAAVPYRLLVETIYTLGQERATKVSLVVQSTTGPGTIEIKLPGRPQSMATREQVEALLAASRGDSGAAPAGSTRPAPAHPSASAQVADAGPPGPLNLNVVFVDEGFVVSASGHRLAPGCREAGAGAAVALRGGAQDLAGLTACVSAIKAAAPAFATEKTVTVSAASSTDVRTLVATLDALRGEGASLFPEVQLGVPK
jgi:biopolymer transport protein ExbD